MTESVGKTAQLTIDGKSIDLPVLSGTEGPDVIDVASSQLKATSPTIQASFPPHRASRTSPTSMAMRECCCTAVIPSNSWRKSPTTWNSAICS